MVIDHKKIEHQGRVVFETITTDKPHTFSYPLIDEACFIHVKHGSNTALTPDEIVEVNEGELAFANSGNLIFKSVPSEETGHYQATVLHLHKDFVLDAFASRFPEIEMEGKPAVRRDVVTGKPCVILNNYIAEMRAKSDTKFKSAVTTDLEERMVLNVPANK